MSSNQNQHQKNTQKRLNNLKQNLRNTLEKVSNFPSSKNSKLVWHHQSKTKKNCKISSYKNFLPATKEIMVGNCIPLTEAEHNKLHRSGKNYPLAIDNKLNVVKTPFFDPCQWRDEIKKV